MARGSGRSHARLVKFGWALMRTLARMWQLRNSVDAADYDYRAWDSAVWLQRYWQRARQRIITGWVGEGPMVDVGCGSSRIIVDLPTALGIDIRHSKLRWLRAHHARLTCASGDALPLRDGSVGTLITSEVIEHVTNAEDHLAEAARVLRPGGTLIAGTPDYGRWLWWVIEWVYGRVLPGAYAHEHVTHYTRASLAASLARHGFEALDVRYVGGCEMIFRARRRAWCGSASTGASSPPGRAPASAATCARCCAPPPRAAGARPSTAMRARSSRTRRPASRSRAWRRRARAGGIKWRCRARSGGAAPTCCSRPITRDRCSHRVRACSRSTISTSSATAAGAGRCATQRSPPPRASTRARRGPS